MAVSKMTTWVYLMRLRNPSGNSTNDGLYLAMKFAVYADLANASANPYVRLENCDFFSPTSSITSARASATVRIQINGTGTTYSFSTGGSVQKISFLEYDQVPEGGDGYYTARFSSSTNIPINKNRTEFTFNLTLTTRNGETYTRVLPACGIIPQTMTGPTSLVTGSISTYNFSTAVRNEYVNGNIRYNFATWIAYAEEIQTWADGHTSPYYWYAAEAFTTPYQLARLTTDYVSTVSFVPIDYSGHLYAKNNGGYACLEYYYIPENTQTYIHGTDNIISYSELQSDFGANRYIYASARDRGLCICFIRNKLTVSTRSTADAVLRPDFKQFRHQAYAPEGSNVYQYYSNLYDEMITKYGGIVQGSRRGSIWADFYADETYVTYREDRPSGSALKYASYFKTGNISENLGGTLRTTAVVADMRLTGNTSLSHINSVCTVDSFSSAGANKKVTFSLTDSFGFTTTVTDTITVIPYHKPSMSLYSARRCRIATSEDTDLYTYNGVQYTPDESGDFALIEWQVDISSLNNVNSRSLRVRMKSSDEWETLAVNSYTASGFLVKPVTADDSYNIQFSMSDDFYTDVIFIAPLNTVYAMIDFKRGGKGVAMGKVSELDYIYDIHRNWTLHMPYNTYVQNYNSNGTAVNLYDWMRTVDQRITGIINSRDVIIFGRYAISGSSRWANGNSSACAPTSYCSITGENRIDITSGGQTFRTGGWMNKNAITINRAYLNISLGEVWSYAGNTATSERAYRPTVYICTSKPTSFNQSTGAPNATILRQQTYNMASTSFNGYESIDGNNVGYYTWSTYHPGSYIQKTYSLNVSSYQGQNVWVVVTATCGYCPVPSDTSPAMYDSVARELSMGGAYIAVEEIWLSKSHV